MSLQSLAAAGAPVPGSRLAAIDCAPVPRLHLKGAVLLDPEGPEPRPGSILVEGGRIAAVLREGEPPPEDAQPVDLGGGYLAPGLIDIHFHGGAIFAPPDQLGDALRRDAEAMARHGVTAWLPTTVAWPGARLGPFVTQLAAEIGRLHDAASSGGLPAASPLGIHLEGPWISSEALGAQPGEGARPYDAAEARDLLDRAEGLVRMVTFAPELPGAGTLLDELTRRGIVPALGHSLADADLTHAAAERGARHVTHLFNAMGRVHQRAPGLAGAALADDRLTCDLICDGVHVSPDLVRVAARAKSDRLLLITDRVDPPPGQDTTFGAGPVHDDGTALRLPDGRLAGSRLHLDHALERYQRFTGASLHAAITACTLAPARLLGIAPTHGTLRPDARADLISLTPDGRLHQTWLAGQPVR